MNIQLVNARTEMFIRKVRLQHIPYPTEHIIVKNESNGDIDFYSVNFPEIVIKTNFFTKYIPFFYSSKTFLAVTHIRHNGIDVEQKTGAERIKEKEKEKNTFMKKV